MSPACTHSSVCSQLHSENTRHITTHEVTLTLSTLISVDVISEACFFFLFRRLDPEAVFGKLLNEIELKKTSKKENVSVYSWCLFSGAVPKVPKNAFLPGDNMLERKGYIMSEHMLPPFPYISSCTG